MFRLVGRKIAQLEGSRLPLVRRAHVSTGAAAAAPSVKDLLIKITFVDPSGARRKVSAMVGRTLYETCLMNDIDIGPSSIGSPPEIRQTESWIEPSFGEGPTSGYDHVILVGNGATTATRMTNSETQMIKDYWQPDEIFEGSRLANAITLTKEMDGMVVYVPDRIIDDVP